MFEIRRDRLVSLVSYSFSGTLALGPCSIILTFLYPVVNQSHQGKLSIRNFFPFTHSLINLPLIHSLSIIFPLQ